MKNVETILAKLVSKNRAFNALTKSFELLKEGKNEEAKEVINSAIEYNKENYTNSNILYRILNMVYELSESNYKFDDIIEYHMEYRSIVDISCFADEWVYGDDALEIKEVSEAVIALADDMLPSRYAELLTYVSKYDTNNMNIIHNCIDYSLIEPVSKMMMAIEQIDVYNIHNLIFEGVSTHAIFKACDEIEDLE